MWLARRLEVSVRTVKRDVDALLKTGVPIWAQAGRGGGTPPADAHPVRLR